MCCLIGFRRVWHSGGISTYKTQVWMYPEVGIAMFVTVSGPNRQDTTWALTSLLHKISDILLTSAEMNQLPRTTVSPAQSLRMASCTQSHRSDSLPTRHRAVSPSRRHIDKLIGAYFSDQYVINVTIAYDESTTDRLLIFVGRYLTAQLQYLDTDDQFNAVVKGTLRWFTDPSFPVWFVMSEDEDRAVAVSFPLYSCCANNTSNYDDWALFSRVSSASSTSTQITWSTVLWSAIGVINIGLQNYNL